MKRFYWFAGVFTLMMNVACSDDLSSVGSSVQPDFDKLSIEKDSLFVPIESEAVTSIYAKTITPLLGTYYDNVFGAIDADFMTEFYCADNFKFDEKWDGLSIDSAYIRLFYKTYLGESNTPQQVTVYRLNKNLPDTYYSDQKPQEYYSAADVIGNASYTGIDYSVSDSIRGTSNYTPLVKVKLNQAFLGSFYNEIKNNPSTFASNNNFRKFFKGVYAKNSFGRGTMLEVNTVDLLLYYTCKDKTAAGKDTTYARVRPMPLTKEVVQLNRYNSASLPGAIGEDFAYLKSPGGYFANVMFPLKDQIIKHGGEIVNNITYSFQISKPEGTKLKPPKYLLLVKDEDYKAFFEEQKVPSASNSAFIATFDSTTYKYTFSNIAPLLNNEIAKYKDTDITKVPEQLKLKIVPVAVSLYTDGYGNSTIDKVTHYFSPAAVRIKKDHLKMPGLTYGHRMDLVFSKSLK